MIILGGDIDLDGALVKIDYSGRYLDHIRFPTREHNVPNGVLKRRIDCMAMIWTLEKFLGSCVDVTAFLEWPSQISANGMLRVSSQHRTVGDIEAALGSQGIDPFFVPVMDWKRNFGLVKKPKADAIPIANRLCGTSIKLKKDVPIAEAALIARYGMRMLKTEEVKAC